jgi:hypothetical protein
MIAKISTTHEIQLKYAVTTPLAVRSVASWCSAEKPLEPAESAPPVAEYQVKVVKASKTKTAPMITSTSPMRYSLP